MAHVLECWRRAGAAARNHLPGGFERYFDELVQLGGSTQAEPEELAALAACYGLEVDPQSIPGLLRRFADVPGQAAVDDFRGES